MRKLLEGVVGISFLILTVKAIAPETLGHWWVQRPAIAVFGVSVPFAFALSLREYYSRPSGKELAGGIVYLLVFLVVVGLVTAGATGGKAMYHSMRGLEVRHPPAIFNALVDAPKPDERRTAAKIIYTEFGGAVPYRAGNKSYRVFTPTAKEREDRERAAEVHKTIGEANQRLLDSSMQSMWNGVYLVCAFFVVFSMTLIVDHLSLTKRSSRRS